MERHAAHSHLSVTVTYDASSENSPAEDDVKTIIESSPKPDDTAAATAVTPYRQPYDAVKNLDDDISIDSRTLGPCHDSVLIHQ